MRIPHYQMLLLLFQERTTLYTLRVTLLKTSMVVAISQMNDAQREIGKVYYKDNNSIVN